MAKRYGTSDEDLFRAAWDMLADISLVHNVQVGYTVLPAKWRGVFELRLRAVRPVPNAKPVQVAAFQLEWPNSQNISLAGAFFRCANQLDHLVTSADATGQMAAESALG